MGTDGYLYQFGFMSPCVGGWKLIEEIEHSMRFVVDVSPSLLGEDVHRAIEKAMRPFEGVVEVSHG